MKCILFLLVLCCLSCNNKPNIPEALIGKWKIYDTKFNTKDISKSSDPTNENGLEFQANGNYISFGNPRHEDQGTYEVNKDDLLFKSRKIVGVTNAKMILAQDTLQLNIAVDSTKTLFMKLYRMK
ncbi:MAG: Unknown protein [uncultured Aureispira sp.]|uniref:Lipocalin-like domain-containing protein n=1 Tax=uncultured Aureispira sp. TaxID=1331704 RepID=A0A6S6ULG4_9BACT|nr:MAG: Unknown protein [uncultured Aureispira sp.]